jgi:hypothetical protein
MDLRALGATPEDFARDLLSNLYYQRGTTVESASTQDMYETLAVTVRDRLAERRARTGGPLRGQPALGLLPVRGIPPGPPAGAEPALQRHRGAGPGGGAGLRRDRRAGRRARARQRRPGPARRLPARLAGHSDMPAVGYGIRYDLGIFKQTFVHGAQVERPDDWAFQGNPWEFPAPDDNQVVGFYGKVSSAADDPRRGRLPVLCRHSGPGRSGVAGRRPVDQDVRAEHGPYRLLLLGPHGDRLLSHDLARRSGPGTAYLSVVASPSLRNQWLRNDGWSASVMCNQTLHMEEA